nr:hypothetical protein Iba_chr10eCG11380 [Ipomoea batatas]
MVLGPIFVGVRCPLREQGARYSPRTDLCGSKVPTTGVRCPLWSSNRFLWEQGAHYDGGRKKRYDRNVGKNYGSKVPARSFNRSITTAVGKNATTEKSEKTTGGHGREGGRDPELSLSLYVLEFCRRHHDLGHGRDVARDPKPCFALSGEKRRLGITAKVTAVTVAVI